MEKKKVESTETALIEAAKKLLDRCSYRFRGNIPGILPNGQEWRGQGFEKGIS